MTSQPIANLSSEEKRALLKKLLQKKTRVQSSYPLSFGQEWLWFFDQLEPASPSYNIPSAARITGPFDLSVAQQVVNEIIRRQASLRTTFAAVNDQPVQVVASALNLPPTVLDLRGLPKNHREQEIKRHAAEEALRPFDLLKGPLLRVTFLVLGEREHVLLVTMHHIIADAWSGAVFIREALALYQAFSRAEPSPLPELPLQYTDYAVWQRQWLNGEVLDNRLAYWRRQLAGLPILELPTDRPRPAVPSYRGAHEVLVLPAALTADLRELSRREGVTLFMTLLAAFKVLLGSYTAQHDIVVGSPTAGRNRAEVENVIGLFVNFLILRTRLSGDPTFRELLRRVRETCHGAYAHQDMPVAKLLQIVRVQRQKRLAPPFQVSLDFEPVTMRPLAIGNLSFTPLPVDPGTAKIDLGLTVRESGETLAGFLEYSTDLFDTSTIRRMREQFVTLLEDVVANPEQRLSSLHCLNATERRQVSLKRYKLRRQGLLDSLDEIEQLSNLTKNQLLLWVGQQLQPDAPIHNIAATLTILGAVDCGAFGAAFQTLINSSDILRSVIEQRDGVPEQRIIPELRDRLEYMDFSHRTNPDAELGTWMHRRCQIRFDFEKCLFDSVLIKLSDRKFVWYLNQHHIITDGWSIWLIFNKMAELYEHSLAGRLEERIDLPSFEDYSRREREYRDTARYHKDEAYWREKLAGEQEPIAFYGKPPLKRTTLVQRRSCELGFERTRKLRSIATRDNIAAGTMDASLFNIFAALFCVYLYRLSGNPSIWFGTPVHNRRSKALEETVGSFVQVLPLHLKIDDGDTFFSLIKKIKSEMFEVMRHGRYAIRNSLHRRCYDVLLNYHHMSNATHRSFHGAPVEAEVVHTGHGNESFGLRILDFGDKGDFALDFDFHCDVFDPNMRDQAIEHFLHVLDSFLAAPEQRLDRVSLLGAAEEQRVLVEFNRTPSLSPKYQTVVGMFESQVQRTPDDPAVVLEDQQLTYRELNRRANQLAHYLQGRGVGPDVLVPICMPRSLAMIVGLLGILKAGGAYVPLDPTYPRERLRSILEDIEPPILLTHRPAIAEFLGDKASEALDPFAHVIGDRARVICVEASGWDVAQQSEQNPVNDVSAESLAYLIYTSGSTGRPRGVLIEHRNLVHSTLARLSHYEEPLTSFLLLSPFAFDSSMAGIFWTLCTGGNLVLPREVLHQDLPQLLELTKVHRVSHLLCLPSFYELMLAEPMAREGLVSLRGVIVAGESCPKDLIERHYHLLPQAKLFNEYGPTEATVWSSVYEGPPQGTSTRVPIGRPIADTHMYLLDKNRQPVPIGSTGEIYIGGAGLARGYLRQPELTVERFIPDPFSPEPGARLYRTGDLGRYLPDGNIEFLGRIDHQVKIRGYRVELDEIEGVLREHYAVRDAVVLAREEVAGGKRLIAYLIPENKDSGSMSDLRQFLKDRLPEYMLPGAYVFLEEFPLTPNGKLDRRRLPARPHAAGVGQALRIASYPERARARQNLEECAPDRTRGCP